MAFITTIPCNRSHTTLECSRYNECIGKTKNIDEKIECYNNIDNSYKCENVHVLNIPKGTVLFCYNKSKASTLIQSFFDTLKLPKTDSLRSNIEIISKLEALQRYLGIVKDDRLGNDIYFTENWQCFFTFVPFVGSAIAGFSNDYSIVNVYVTTADISVACLVNLNFSQDKLNLINRTSFRLCDGIGPTSSTSADTTFAAFDPYIPLRTRREKYMGFVAVTRGDSIEKGSAKSCIEFNCKYPKIYDYIKYHIVSDSRKSVHGFLELAIPPLKFDKTIAHITHDKAIAGDTYYHPAGLTYDNVLDICAKNYIYKQDGPFITVTKNEVPTVNRFTDCFNFDLLFSIQNISPPRSKSVINYLHDLNMMLLKELDKLKGVILMDNKTGMYVHTQYIYPSRHIILNDVPVPPPSSISSELSTIFTNKVLSNPIKEPKYSLIKYYSFDSATKAILEVPQTSYIEIANESLSIAQEPIKAGYMRNKKKYTKLLQQ